MIPEEDRDLIIRRFLEPVLSKENITEIKKIDTYKFSNNVLNDAFINPGNFVKQILGPVVNGKNSEKIIPVTGTKGFYTIEIIGNMSGVAATAAVAKIYKNGGEIGDEIATLTFERNSIAEFANVLSDLAKNQITDTMALCSKEFTKSDKAEKIVKYGMKYMIAILEETRKWINKDYKKIAKEVGSDVREETLSYLEKRFEGVFDIFGYFNKMYEAIKKIDSGDLDEMDSSELLSLLDEFEGWIDTLPK